MSARVVVTDGEERAVLGACRALASAGYYVSAVARYRPAAAHWSRSCATRFVVADPRDSVPAFVDQLEQLLRSDEYAVLIPGSDASLLAISEHRRRLEPLTHLGLPPDEAVQRCVDKVLLHRVAAAAGLPPPASRRCTDAGAAAEAAAELGYPAMVKPSRSFSPSGDGFQQRGVARVEDEAALLQAVPKVGTPFIVQRFERARCLFSCTGVIADGTLLALTTSRVRRLWPPLAGMATFSETVAPPLGLGGRVQGILAALGWQGIFQIQMLELDDGGFSVLDLNPRLFASVALDIGAGVNLAAVWCDWLLGRQPVAVTGRPGVRYRWEEGELCHLVWQLRRRRIRAALSVLLPRRRVAHAWFRITDPGPFVARVLYLGARAAKKTLMRGVGGG